MTLDRFALAAIVSSKTGMKFEVSDDKVSDGLRCFELIPAGHPPINSFSIRTEVGWRRIDVRFRLGVFASDLLTAIGMSDDSCRRSFRSILDACCNAGAEISLRKNGTQLNHNDPRLWSEVWRSFEFSVGKGMLAINDGDSVADLRIIGEWTSRVASAALLLLPTEDSEDDAIEMRGLPEGARIKIEANRFERDRRNRAAALAIHGHRCLACGLDMAELYGPAASGLIEIHHVDPLSVVGSEHFVDPQRDLVPLCPSCHAVAHRRSPPYSIGEIKDMIRFDWQKRMSS